MINTESYMSPCHYFTVEPICTSVFPDSLSFLLVHFFLYYPFFLEVSVPGVSSSSMLMHWPHVWVLLEAHMPGPNNSTIPSTITVTLLLLSATGHLLVLDAHSDSVPSLCWTVLSDSRRRVHKGHIHLTFILSNMKYNDIWKSYRYFYLFIYLFVFHNAAN